MVLPFQHLRIVDLSTRLSGAFAARLFGDFGAEVLLCESPEGHCLRHQPPFLNDEPGLETSVVHAYFNWNKHSVLIGDESDLPSILQDADVVVTTNANSDYLDAIRSLLPKDAVHLSVTSHGVDDPLSHVPGNNLTMSARVGWASINGYRDEPPLSMPRDQSGVVGGLTGYIAAAAALRRRAYGDTPELVDVSELEAFALTVHPWGVAAVYNGVGRTRSPGGGRKRGDPAPLWDLADGRMNFGLADFHNWKEAMEVMNLPDQGSREDLQSDFGRHSRDMRDVVWRMTETLPKLKRWAVFHALAKLRCVIGVVQNPADLLTNEHLTARDYFIKTEINEQSVTAAGAPAKLSPVPWQVHQPAPKFGSKKFKAREHRTKQTLQEINDRDLAEGPLAGVRVLSFGQAWSGTFGTELLALLGADVVQIAALDRPDSFRRISNVVPSAVVDDSKTQHPRNTQGHYNSVNLHKREITLNLGTDRGKELLWKLLPNFDMVVDNFRPNVLPNWGVTLESLHKVRPGAIWASISGYGEYGPYARYPANGATTEPMAGLSSIHGYEGDVGGMNTGGLFPDPISGYSLVATILAALSHRDATGEPQRIDLSMLEAVTTVIGDAVLEYDATSTLPRPRGNRHLLYAPHSMYRAQDDQWVALAVESDDAWIAVCKYIGDPRLVADRFATRESRKKHEEELDQYIGEWCIQRSAESIERDLGSLGACAARIVPLYEIYSKPDDHFREAKFVQLINHPEAGKTWLPGRPWRYSAAASSPIRHAPCVGEHSFEVFSQELGMDRAEYERLVEEGISGNLDEVAALHTQPS